MEYTPLSWEAIVQRYPDQWVSLVEVEKGSAGEVKSGIVTAAGPDIKTVTKILSKSPPRSLRFEYTGRIRCVVGLARWGIEDIENNEYVV